MDEAGVHFTALDRPVVDSPYFFRWDDAARSYVLLHPEGIIRLNETAGEILKRCDGDRSVAQLVDELREIYADADGEVDAAVRDFLELARARGWIRPAQRRVSAVAADDKGCCD